MSLTRPVVRPLATAVYWSGAMSMTQVPLPSGMPASVDACSAPRACSGPCAATANARERGARGQTQRRDCDIARRRPFPKDAQPRGRLRPRMRRILWFLVITARLRNLTPRRPAPYRSAFPIGRRTGAAGISAEFSRISTMSRRCESDRQGPAGGPQGQPLEHQDQAALPAEPAQRHADLGCARPLGQAAHLGECAQDASTIAAGSMRSWPRPTTRSCRRRRASSRARSPRSAPRRRPPEFPHRLRRMPGLVPGIFVSAPRAEEPDREGDHAADDGQHHGRGGQQIGEPEQEVERQPPR